MEKDTLVLFDIGGVMLELNYSRFYNEAVKYIPKHKKVQAEEFKKKYADTELEKRVLTGKITTKEFADGIRSVISPDTGWEKDDDILSLYSQCWKGPIDSTVRLKYAIHNAGHAVGLFSNISEYGVRKLSGAYPDLFETFGGPQVYSYLIGDIKPNPPMYRTVQELGFKKIIFIDDKESYLRTGEKFGWYCSLFTPYVDSSEAIKSFLGHSTANQVQETEKFRVANNEQELRTVLMDFGVNGEQS